MKSGKLVATITLILMICCLCLMVSGVYAVVSGIYEKHEVLAKSDFLTIDSQPNAFKEFFGVRTATTLTVNKTHDADTALEISGADLLVFSQTTLVQDTYTKMVELSDGTYCYVFPLNLPVGTASANFTFTPTAQSNISIFAVASKATQDGVQKTYKNAYITSIFDLQLVNDQELYENPDVAVSYTDSFCTLWFLDDITIPDGYRLKIPAYINLLNATVTLLGDFSIEHYFGGLYTIEGISGGFYADPALTSALKIIAPNAYYETSYLTVAKLQNVTLDLNSIDFSLSDDTDAKTVAVFDDAISFALDRVPSFVFYDTILAFRYHSSGISFSYLLDGEAISQWTVEELPQNTAVTLTVNAIFKDEIVRTATKTVTVCGTNDDSIAAAALSAISQQMNLHYTTDLSGKISDFNKNVDLLDSLSAVLKGAKAAQTLTVSVSDISGCHFEYGANSFEDFSLIYDPVSFTFDLVTTQGRVDINVSDKVWFVPAGFLEQDSGAVFSVTYNASVAVTTTFVWTGNTKTELEQYLNRMTNTPYVMTTEDVTQIFYLSEGRLLLTGTDLINIHAFNGVTSGVLRLSEQEYQQLQAGTAEISDFVAESSFDGFSTANGQLQAIRQIEYENGYVYVFYQTFTYDSGSSYYDALNSEFSLFRQIIIPSSGIGGSQYEKYLSGATFAAYFDSLPNNKLLDTSNFAALASNADIYMQLYFTDEEGANNVTHEFCKFSTAADGFVGLYDSILRTQSFKLAIDISKVPEINSPIYITVVFTSQSAVSSATAGATAVYFAPNAVWDSDNRCFMLDGFAVTSATANATVVYFAEGAEWINGIFYEVREISVQRYSFIVPGIYFCSDSVLTAQFCDQDFYDAIIYNIINNINLTVTVVSDSSLQTYNLNNYVFRATDADYLLVDGASIIKKMIYTNNSNGSLDTRGVQYLINATEIDFSGYQISSLDTFALYNATALVTLSMKGCGLTNAIVGNNLYAINTLLTVDLSENALTSIEGILYRTVETLDVSFQRSSGTIRSLNSIVGINGLNALNTLNISGNAIDEFYLLTQLGALSEVRLGQNTGSGANGYYGTCGSVNLPEYVTLLEKGVTVYAANTSLVVEESASMNTTANTVTAISKKQRLAALQINAIIVSYTHYDFVLMPSAIGAYAINLVALTKGGVAQTVTESVDIYGNNKINCTSLVDGDQIKVILSVTVDGVTVYKQFNLNYKTT